ncbi:MAG: transposase, partial [Gammaproteobacteria bacterium]|nr:transposase [Gammaproteobacteria bacterium]
IKSYFTRACKKQGICFDKNTRGENDLWQARFWEHTIRDEKDLEQHINYIHYNPVKHGLVKSVKDWPYSSFHRFVKQGLLSKDWGGEVEGFIGLYGE